MPPPLSSPSQIGTLLSYSNLLYKKDLIIRSYSTLLNKRLCLQRVFVLHWWNGELYNYGILEHGTEKGRACLGQGFFFFLSNSRIFFFFVHKCWWKSPLWMAVSKKLFSREKNLLQLWAMPKVRSLLVFPVHLKASQGCATCVVNVLFRDDFPSSSQRNDLIKIPSHPSCVVL